LKPFERVWARSQQVIICLLVEEEINSRVHDLRKRGFGVCRKPEVLLIDRVLMALRWSRIMGRCGRFGGIREGSFRSGVRGK
jgi:hypothetical protein